MCLALIPAQTAEMSETLFEEKLAHLTRTVEDLSDVVTQQDTEIALLTRRVAMLMEREGERDALEGNVTVGDQRPPHY